MSEYIPPLGLGEIEFPSDNFLMKWEHRVHKDCCDQLVDYFEKLKLDKDRRIQFNPVGNYIGMFDKFDLDNQSIAMLYANIVASIQHYVIEYPFLSNGLDPWKVCDIWHLQEYEPGNYYKREHCEHGKDFYDNKRILAWMVYLNECDGGTRWPNQKFTSKPEKGDLYLWPASWTHSHFGIPSDEKKWIATGWCIFEDPDDEKKMEDTVLNNSN
tara:strand:- start:175 stop:813 length:639 start_codon:yes stop_codon:yes gene_type:complete